MHIVMVSGEYPPRWGGMGSVVYHLAGHMAQRGHKVTVITRKHKQMPPTHWNDFDTCLRWGHLFVFSSDNGHFVPALCHMAC